MHEERVFLMEFAHTSTHTRMSRTTTPSSDASHGIATPGPKSYDTDLDANTSRNDPGLSATTAALLSAVPVPAATSTVATVSLFTTTSLSRDCPIHDESARY